jgi:hypothetical protein
VPGHERFYGDLDSVRYAPSLPEQERELRDTATTGTLMLDLLAGRSPT